jgi:serine acetyltransferase
VRKELLGLVKQRWILQIKKFPDSNTLDCLESTGSEPGLGAELGGTIKLQGWVARQELPFFGTVGVIDNFKLKLRRGETPIARFLRRLVIGFLRSNLPQPAWIRPVLRNLYEMQFSLVVLFRRVLIYFYREPLFRARCTSVGKQLHIYTELPYVEGHAEIHIGDNVSITGPLVILSGRFLARPMLRVHDRVVIGGNTFISVNQEVTIGEDVMISTNCRISDNDGHPREAHLRIQHAPLRPRDIRPVCIQRYAWIGSGAQIMKGVTIGEGAIIGANSVVISNIPAYSVAMGNPAEIYFRNVGRPATSAPKTKSPANSVS